MSTRFPGMSESTFSLVNRHFERTNGSWDSDQTSLGIVRLKFKISEYCFDSELLSLITAGGAAICNEAKSLNACRVMSD